MSNVAIKAEGLGKKYNLKHQVNREQGLRHVLEEAVASLWKPRLRKIVSSSNDQVAPLSEEFWALQNVSFEIRRGEVVGIIGRNGAGKSTLLKILSRITEPTTGSIEMEGRVASLLEVGTGFHPELTGRENVYLNGAILGMSRAEIRKKFDEIVAFAEVEKFLDTPVKHFSSGMYVRLAFAVAAHLEPEILIVDEVLAVGDGIFQKKCLAKMQEISSKDGLTVLFVSHNMAAVGKLCQRSILLGGGKLQLVGPTEEVIANYLTSGAHISGIRIWDDTVQSGFDSRWKIRALRILGPEGTVAGHVDIRHPFTIEVEYKILTALPPFRIGLRFLTTDGTIAFVSSDSTTPSYDFKPLTPGSYCSRCFVPGNLLNEGIYSLTLGADIPFEKILFREENVIDFSVEPTGGVNSRFYEKWPGVVCPQLGWETKPTILS
jgi:lipopolysaccharide transport system ATP-binding protein